MEVSIKGGTPKSSSYCTADSAEFRPGAPSGKMVYIILAGASSFRKSGFSGASTGSYMDEL